MKALDTNILVRFLVKNDERQSRAVYAAFKSAEAESREQVLLGSIARGFLNDLGARLGLWDIQAGNTGFAGRDAVDADSEV